MLTKEWKLNALRQILGHESITKGDEVVFHCPKCKHRKPKLSVNLKTDSVHCWICDRDLRGKNLVPVLRFGGSGNQFLRAYLAEIKELRPRVLEERKYDNVRLPDGFRTLSRDWRSPWQLAALDYLVSRGLSEEDILLYKLGYCEEGPYKNRVIIPSFDNYGGLNFVAGRAIYDGMLNYKHENICKDVIWNDYLIDWSSPLAVTEGQFDAMIGGKNTTALQGSILRENSALFEKIVESGVDVYFAMDSDAFKKQLSIIELFLSYGVRSYYVDLQGHKDVALMGKEKFAAARQHAKRVNSQYDILRMRVGA